MAEDGTVHEERVEDGAESAAAPPRKAEDHVDGSRRPQETSDDHFSLSGESMRVKRRQRIMREIEEVKRRLALYNTPVSMDNFF